MSSPTETPTPAPAEAANAPVINIVSVRQSSRQFQQQSESKAPNRPAKQPKAAKPPAEKKASSRNSSANIAGTIIPPARVKTAMMAALSTECPEEIQKIRNKLQELKTLISKASTDESIPRERISQAEANIEHCKRLLAEPARKKYDYRVSDCAPSALTAFLSWLVMTVYDTVASNLLASGPNTTITFNNLMALEKGVPLPEKGGINLLSSPAAPFICQLPVIRDWNPLVEEELAKKHSEEDQKKKDAAAARAAARAAAPADAGAPAKKTSTRTAHEGPCRYDTFISQLIKESAAQISPEYKALRTNWRMKVVLNDIVTQSIDAFVAGITPYLQHNGSVTVTGNLVEMYLTAVQRSAKRPEEEINSLAASVSTAVSRWETHSQAARQARAAEAAAKQSDVERLALEAKKAKDAEMKKKRATERALSRAVAAARSAGLTAEADLVDGVLVTAKKVAENAQQEAEAEAAKTKAILSEASARREAESKAKAAASSVDPVEALLGEMPTA